MSTIAILGAGEIGGALARQLAASDVASRIVLVDDQAGVAAGKALDIAQAAPVDRYSTSLSGTSDVSAVTGAAVVVLADRFGPAGEWRGEDGLALLKRIAGLNQVACVVCAGTEQQSVIERGVTELGLARTRLFGSAPEALRAAVVTMAALEAKAAPADVSLSVVGRPTQAIVPWDEGAIAGRSAPQVLTAAQLARLERACRPALAAGTGNAGERGGPRDSLGAHAIATRAHRAGRADEDEGTAGRSAMLPVTLAPDGIAQIVAPALSSRDRVRLETALRA